MYQVASFKKIQDQIRKRPIDLVIEETSTEVIDLTLGIQSRVQNIPAANC